MAYNASNPKLARKELAVLLTPALVGTSLPLKKLFDHDATDWENEAPVLMVTRPGIQREKSGMGPTPPYDSTFLLELMVVVPDPDTESGWTAAMQDDALDDIATIIANVIGDNTRHSPYWEEIRFLPQFSAVTPIKADSGMTYKQENHLVLVKHVKDP